MKARANPIKMIVVMLLLSSVQTLEAQDYEPGYIILNSKDTLFGSVKIHNDSRRLDKIKFKNDDVKAKNYRATDLLGYRVGVFNYESHWYAEESEFLTFWYYNRPGYGRKIFLRVLAKGYLSCYAKEFWHDDNDYPDYFELFLRQGENTFQRATQGIFGLKKKNLSKYFWDCPELVNKINNLSITRPLDVVDYYNSFCIEKL